MHIIRQMTEDKLHGKKLSQEQFHDMMQCIRQKDYDEAQLAAWLMAVQCLGLDNDETAAMTMEMMTPPDPENGLVSIVDKHSTGGVGDSVTLIAVPIVCACGIPLIKLSGKKLGFTGGTVDKLQAIPGINLEKNNAAIRKQVEEVGAYLGMQTDDLCICDKILYELRDRTGSVSSIPLIASSILSKKFSTGAKNLVINLKYGNGAFIETRERAEQLKETMTHICENNHINVAILLEETNAPISQCIGTGIEVKNAYELLAGNSTAIACDVHLLQASLDVATEMVRMVKNITHEQARQACQHALDSGRAKTCFEKIIQAQDGDLQKLLASKPAHKYVLRARRSGTLTAMNTARIGQLINDNTPAADPLFGVRFHKHLHDHIAKDDIILTIEYNTPQAAESIRNLADSLSDCLTIKKLT